MKHTTNYRNTFIEVADDSPAKTAQVPPVKGERKSIANLQFELLIDAPYKYTSDDLLFKVHAIRNGIGKNEMDLEREKFFSKGQACMRASPLTKRYGWGVHSDDEGRIALYGAGSKEYEELLQDARLKKVKAMRSARG